MSKINRDPVETVTSIRGTTLFGISIVGSFMSSLGLWAITVPISGAVVATGHVVTDNQVQVVRHERGGVVEAVHVREGDKITAGQPLAVLSRAEDRSAREELVARLGAMTARQARLMIEQSENRQASVTLLDVVGGTGDLALAKVDALVADQNEALSTRRNQREVSLDIFRTQKITVEQQRSGLEGELTSMQVQLASIGEDIRLRKQAANAGLGRESILREMERQSETIRGSITKAESGLLQLGLQAKEIEQKMAGTRTEFLEKVSEELSKIRAERLETEEALSGRNQALARVGLKAPISGVVNKIHINTIGSAVEAFAPLIEIVGEDKQAVIEVRVLPSDIDDVYPSQHARVVLSAFNRHAVDPVEGQVTFVAADARLDEATRQPFYTVRLALDKDMQAKLPAVIPGMPAEAYLLKHDRTFVDYLAEPFIQSFYRAFR